MPDPIDVGELKAIQNPHGKGRRLDCADPSPDKIFELTLVSLLPFWAGIDHLQAVHLQAVC